VTPELAQTLAMAAARAADAVEPWWIIGSAAVLLHGGHVGRVKDVDLLMSASDADAFLRRAGVSARGGEASDRFRSKIFGNWAGPPVPVEVFGGFEAKVGGVWREVQLTSRDPVSVGGAQVFVPSVPELIRLLNSFGRPKDLDRVLLLQR